MRAINLFVCTGLPWICVSRCTCMCVDSVDAMISHKCDSPFCISFRTWHPGSSFKLPFVGETRPTWPWNSFSLAFSLLFFLIYVTACIKSCMHCQSWCIHVRFNVSVRSVEWNIPHVHCCSAYTPMCMFKLKNTFVETTQFIRYLIILLLYFWLQVHDLKFFVLERALHYDSRFEYSCCRKNNNSMSNNLIGAIP